MASVRKVQDKPPKYQVKQSTGRRNERGTYLYVERTAGSLKEANRIAAELQLKYGNASRTGDETMADHWQAWIAHLEAKGRAPHTIAGYEGYWRRNIGPIIGDMRVSAVRPRDIERIHAAMRATPPPEHRRRKGPMSPTTVRQANSILKACLHQAVRWGIIDANPADRVDPPPLGRNVIHPPAAVSVAHAIAVAREGWGDDAALLVRLAAATGARRGELAALRWSDVDLDAGVIHIQRAATDIASFRGERITKTVGSVRSFAVDDTTRDALMGRLRRAEARAESCGETMRADGFVLSAASDSSQWWPPDRWSHSWARIRDRAGLEGVRLHDLRHFMATELLNAGVPLADVSERLGHAKKTTTLDIYVSGSRAGDRAAADVMGRILG